VANFTFYTDLRSVTFSESGPKASWINAMRVGKHTHPLYGELDFTPDRLVRFAESVKARVRGIDPDIDYDHKLKTDEAAGWVKDAKVVGDQLMLLVEWTKTAADKIKEGAYRYFSPEFRDEWVDSKGQKFQDVIFGGGITNRPFLKDLLPLNLSELSFNSEENPMTEEEKALRRTLGLPEDASQADVNAKVVQLQSQPRRGDNDSTSTAHGPNAQVQNTPPATTIPGGPNDTRSTDQQVQDAHSAHPLAPGSALATSLSPAQLSELGAAGPIVKLLMEQQANTQRMLAEVTRQNQLAEVDRKLSEFSTGTRIVSPAALAEARKVLAVTPVALHEPVYAMLNTMRTGTGSVQLGETVGTSSYSSALSEENGMSATDIVEKRARALMDKDKDMSFSDATIKLLSEDASLFKAYQDESYLFKA
jgi:hypothetical protein